jgi:putative transposase
VSTISYRNTSHPAISIWELKAAEKRASEDRPDAPVDEERIFSAYDKMRSIEENARKLTKKARREAERKRIGVTKAKEHVSRKPEETVEMPAVVLQPRRDLKPFDDVDDMEDA